MIFREIILSKREQKIEFLEKIQYNEEDIVKANSPPKRNA